LSHRYSAGFPRKIGYDYGKNRRCNNSNRSISNRNISSSKTTSTDASESGYGKKRHCNNRNRLEGTLQTKQRGELNKLQNELDSVNL
jgi:hypothetical protein